MKPCHDLPIVGNSKAGALVDWLCQAQGETREAQVELLRMEALHSWNISMARGYSYHISLSWKPCFPKAFLFLFSLSI